MNRWFMGESMAKTSFTVHLDEETANKIVEMKEENPQFSRNALIRLAVREYRLRTEPLYTDVDSIPKRTQMTEEFDWYMIKDFKLRINALHKQNNPDWKRKRSLPYHFPEEYHDILNYTSYHGKDSE